MATEWQESHYDKSKDWTEARDVVRMLREIANHLENETRPICYSVSVRIRGGAFQAPQEKDSVCPGS